MIYVEAKLCQAKDVHAIDKEVRSGTARCAWCAQGARCAQGAQSETCWSLSSRLPPAWSPTLSPACGWCPAARTPAAPFRSPTAVKHTRIWVYARGTCLAHPTLRPSIILGISEPALYVAHSTIRPLTKPNTRPSAMYTSPLDVCRWTLFSTVERATIDLNSKAHGVV